MAPAETAVTDPDASLRRDIRRLGTQLGDTLVRQHGRELLDRVEQVRTLSRGLRRETDQGGVLAELLHDVDVAEAILLVRAFTTYFHLANTAEQVHRVDDLSATAADSRRFAETVGSLIESGIGASEIV